MQPGGNKQAQKSQDDDSDDEDEEDENDDAEMESGESGSESGEQMSPPVVAKKQTKTPDTKVNKYSL